MLISHNVDIGKNTPYAAEMRKWEANYTQYGPPGRPYEYRPYPTMLYRPTRSKQNGAVEFEGQTANTEQERESLEHMGFVHGGKAVALQALERQEFEYAELAANRAATDRVMGANAQLEADRVDSGTIQHLPVLPEAHPKTGRRLDR